MPTLEEREAAIRARCTEFAAQQLAQLRRHPRFPDVLTYLEGIPNTIYELDVEHAIQEILKPGRTP